MSASESSPLTTNLQESIEHLIAETVRRSQVDHENEQKHLREALEQALSEVETGKAAMTRAAEVLRKALENPSPTETPTDAVAIKELVEENPASPVDVPTEATATEAAQGDSTQTPEPEHNPRDLDVVAHNVNFRIAGSLQKWLTERDEVELARTRSYVDNELHMELKLASSIRDTDLKAWLTEHNGTVATHTSSVLELRFSS